MTRAPVLAATVALCAAAGCGQPAEGDGRPAGRPGGARPPQAVEIAVAQRQRVEDAITGTGQIEAIQSIALRPSVEGRITEILFREGAHVAAGTPLFRVDDAELRAQVARAEADRDLAAQAFDRMQQLMASQGTSRSEVERAEAQARAAQAALDLLQVRLERTTVRAPFGGVTGARLVSLGDYVTSQSQLVTLQTVDPQRVTLTVPERYASKLRRGLRVEFSVAALEGNRHFSGVVDFVDPTVRLPARTILIKAQVPNPRGELQAGMFVEGRLVAATRENAVVVPEEAVVAIQGGAVIWIAHEGKAVKRDVDLGLRMPGQVEVTRGIEAGDSVIVGGAERLTEGAPVRPSVVARD